MKTRNRRIIYAFGLLGVVTGQASLSKICIDQQTPNWRERLRGTLVGVYVECRELGLEILIMFRLLVFCLWRNFAVDQFNIDVEYNTFVFFLGCEQYPFPGPS